MATLIRKKDDPSDVVVCGNCECHAHFKEEELRWVTDQEPNFGFDCPGCGKTILMDGEMLK